MNRVTKSELDDLREMLRSSDSTDDQEAARSLSDGELATSVEPYLDTIREARRKTREAERSIEDSKRQIKRDLAHIGILAYIFYKFPKLNMTIFFIGLFAAALVAKVLIMIIYYVTGFCILLDQSGTDPFRQCAQW